MTKIDKKYDVIGLGSCTMDMIFSVDDILRMELIDRNLTDKKYIAIEYSSKLNVKNVKFYPGGSAANVVCNLSNIGFKTAYIGSIGDDINGETCLTDMKNHKVDVSGVKIFKEGTTAVSIILITPWGKDRSVLAYKGANNLFAPEYISKNMLLSTRCFVWTSLTSDTGINAIKKCIELTKEGNGLIAAAPSLSIIKKCHKETLNLLKYCDIVSLNDEELRALTNKEDIREGMSVLFNLGLKLVNITFGKEGQWLSDGKDLIKTNPPKVFPKDTTGAGDATMSGIIYGTLEQKDLKEIARLAVSLSAMEIEEPGVRIGTPSTYPELEKFMNAHKIEQEIDKY